MLTYTKYAFSERMKRILITGGGGAVGRRLIPYLGKNAEIVSLDLKEVPAATRSVVGSVTDADAVADAVAGVDAVLHMAYEHDLDASLAQQVEVNIAGAGTVLDACVQQRISRVVLASTVMTVWGSDEIPRSPAHGSFTPKNIYSYTKCCQELLAEMYTRQHDFLSALCLRIGTPYRTPEDPTRCGPVFSMPRDPESLLPWDDLCEAFRLALFEAPAGKFVCLYLTGEYADGRYDVAGLKETLGLKHEWIISEDPAVDGAYIFRRKSA